MNITKNAPQVTMYYS